MVGSVGANRKAIVIKEIIRHHPAAAQYRAVFAVPVDHKHIPRTPFRIGVREINYAGPALWTPLCPQWRSYTPALRCRKGHKQSRLLTSLRCANHDPFARLTVGL